MRLFSIFIVLSALLHFSACSQSPQSKPVTEKKSAPEPRRVGLEVATFAGGCFWCTEGVLERLQGVEEAISGYTGGTTSNPTYEEISSGTTGHAEAVQIWYDPKLVSYKQLLEAFFVTHDPTTLNRQGPDVGSQYRSAIFYRTKEEEQQARQVIEELIATGKVKGPIVTELKPFNVFFEAEEYHQNYYNRHPNQPYIKAVARPKMEKLEKEYKGRLKK